MKVDRQEIGGIVVATVAAPVEIGLGNAEEFKTAVIAAVGGARRAVLDVSLVEFFDSAGMSSLLSVQKRVAVSEGRLALVGLNRAIQDVFRMVGFDAVFETHADVPQALEALKD